MNTAVGHTSLYFSIWYSLSSLMSKILRLLSLQKKLKQPLFGSRKYWHNKYGCQKVFCHFAILRLEITSAMPLVPFSVNMHPSAGHAAASVATIRQQLLPLHLRSYIPHRNLVSLIVDYTAQNFFKP